MAPCEFYDNDEQGEVEPEEPEEPEVEPEEDGELKSRELVDIYIINRDHIREQSKSVIPVCGVLLTGVFGLLYFIFRGDNNQIQINQYAMYVLVAAAIILVSSILASIKSVQASSPEKLPWTWLLYLDYIVDIYNREYEWGKWSIRLLGIALFLFIILILYFSLSYLPGTPSTNSVALVQFPNFIIIPLPKPF